MAGATRAVFLSYRREETRHIAGPLADRLTDRLGPEQVFMDVDTIESGADFAAAIAREVVTCKVLITLIGRIWTTTTDQWGRRRLDDPDDFVVLGIRAALERGIYVIPVLVDGAVMPDRGDLPEGLQGLARRHAVRLDHATFRSDLIILPSAVDRILSTPKEPLSPLPPTPPSPPLWMRFRPWLLITAAIVITLTVAGSIVLFARTIPLSGSPSATALTVWRSPDGRHAYITNSSSGSVSVIDTGVG